MAVTIRHYARSGFGVTALVTSVIMWILAVHGARFDQIGSYGLVSVLHWPYFFGLAVLVIGLSHELLRSPLQSWILALLVVLLVIYLFATAPAIEPVAALGDSWLHASFVRYISTHGHVLNNYDARFSWPGAFALAAAVTSFVGRSSAVVFLRWFPPFIELLYLAPLVVIGQSSGVGKRTAWLGVVLFYASNWIYQDYFSPQALTYFWYLVVIAVCLAGWRARPLTNPNDLPMTSRLRRSLEVFRLRRWTGHDAERTWPPATTVALVVVVALFGLASAMSHQLTPFTIVLMVIALVLTRRMGSPEVAILTGLFALGWLSLGASNFWVGHLSLIFGSVGSVGNTIGANVTSRVTGSSSHLIVVDLRILSVVALFAAAAIGALRRAADTRTLEALLITPFVLLVLQSYGGEGLMRVVLFALPFTSLLAASAIAPARRGPIRPILRVPHPTRRTKHVLGPLIAIGVLAFAVSTTITRGGNDAYEAFAPGEVAAVTYAYSHASPGQSVGSVTYYLPAYQGSLNVINAYVAVGDHVPPLSQLLKRLDAHRPAWIILGKSQEAWGEIVAGYPKGWESRLSTQLVRHGYVVARRWASAEVLRRAGIRRKQSEGIHSSAHHLIGAGGTSHDSNRVSSLAARVAAASPIPSRGRNA